MELDGITFLDVEADREGRPLELGVVRGARSRRIALAGRSSAEIRRALADCLGQSGPIAGHNLTGFDLPLLHRAGMLPEATGLLLPAQSAGARRNSKRLSVVLDTLLLSMLADPARPSHALLKAGEVVAGGLPDPVADAQQARELFAETAKELLAVEPAVAEAYVLLFEAGGDRGLRWLWETARGRVQASSLEQAVAALPTPLLGRFCRVRLAHLLTTLTTPEEHLSLAFALRFISLMSKDGRLVGPPAPSLAPRPRFHELLVRLMGPLCPDHGCSHRFACDVHRPFAEDVLREIFELPGFRAHQGEIAHAVLAGQRPLAILPTGGGKSLCFQLPAVHGALRLRGLTVIVSPLQALMADQVRSLAARYPGTCLINSSLLQEERRRILAGVRCGDYDIVYLGPEQLRNPSIVRLLSRRLPFLWVIDEAHCISQWGHGFRTDYTYLPRAIANIHGHSCEPLLGLFTATATSEVATDIREQMRRGMSAEVQTMDFSGPRDNLQYEVVAVCDDGAKDREIAALLDAHPIGARLIYCATVRMVRDVTERLRARGIPCAMYHGQLPPNAKKEQLERFLSDEVRTVVATSAFGMGIDKSDIRLVIHHDLPGSIEDYIQETGRAGRDGAPARCVFLFDEHDLETQFFLKTAGLVTDRDVRIVFRALRRRALRAARDADGWAALWVSPEELFVEEELENVLDWQREGLHGKLKLVLYHLEADGVASRLENRTRSFAVHPLLPTIEAARAALPSQPSPATLRVLEYLYDRDRPQEIAILDVADEAGLSPSDAFRELHKLTEAGIIGQDLRFGVTYARGVPRSTDERAALLFRMLETLLDLDENVDSFAMLGLRAAAAEIAHRTGQACPPHELLGALRALRRLMVLRVDKAGPGRFRVTPRDGFVRLREHLREMHRACRALLSWVDARAVGRQGRDIAVELDVQAFLRDQQTLFNRPGIVVTGPVAPAADGTIDSKARRASNSSSDLFDSVAGDKAVEACLLLHHFEAWHLSDPPVLFDISFKVRVDPRRTARDLDRRRPQRQREHEISLVHLLREYAVLPAQQRASYLQDYFALARGKFLDRWFSGRKKAIRRPVSVATEQAVLDGLTQAQQDAVKAEDPALLVVAGPGTGKTHTIVRRVAHLIRARQVRGDEILVLAFSRAAAEELRTRLSSQIGPRARDVRVRTFHGLALELTGDSLRDDRRDIENWLDTALTRAAQLLTPGGEDPKADEANRAGGAADAVGIDAEELRMRVLGRVRHVLVDEYQDLDPDQYRMLRALVGAHHHVKRRGKPTADGLGEEAPVERSTLVVGDDDQAIFGFRNASVDFLRGFESEFGARRICLVENFRSHPRIVEAAARFATTLVGRLKQDPAEQLRPAERAAKPVGDEPSPAQADRALRRFRYESPRALAAHCLYIAEKTLEPGRRRMAMLAREWHDLSAIRGLLEQRRIPFTLAHRGFHRPLHRRYPCDRVLRQLWNRQEPIQGSAREAIEAWLVSWGRSLDEPVVQELLHIVRAIDADAGLDRLGPSTRAKPNVPACAGSPVDLAIDPREVADRLLLASRDTSRRFDGAPSSSLCLSTFHGAKGLEFDKVIVLPCVPRRDADQDEERRLYYVAITRARSELVVTTLGTPGDLALAVDAPELDLRRLAARIDGPEIAYLDCDPSDVVLQSIELGRAQATISRLREGQRLVVREGQRSSVELCVIIPASTSESAADGLELGGASCPPSSDSSDASREVHVATLSVRGRGRYEALRRSRAGRASVPVARVHEIYVHLVRSPEGDVRRQILVVLPTFRFGA